VSADRPADVVAELAGLDGAFSFPEKLLQRIWARGDFDRRGLHLRDGRALRLRRRGRWNRLAGPDFLDAEIEVGEGPACEVLRGSIEVHLRAADWDAHGHAKDPAYDRVVLHVVLFPSMREWTAGASGRRIPILELLPRLERDLEAYAEEAAVEGIAGRPYSLLREQLAGVPPAVLRAQLERQAERRWVNKVRLAAERLGRLGWEEACHRSALEVLGYRSNRLPMLAVAECFPLAAWRAGDVSVEAAWEAPAEPWQSAGVRPANRPCLRLAQYAEWIAARPDWPERLAAIGGSWGAVELGASSTADLRSRRRQLRMGLARKALSQDVCGGILTGTRFDTWVCDAVLPLLAARFGAGLETADSGWAERWRLWNPGDAPEELLRLAREFEVGGAPEAPLAQGHLQGLLGWLAALASRGGRGA
jgi:hypothetical protein